MKHIAAMNKDWYQNNPYMAMLSGGNTQGMQGMGQKKRRANSADYSDEDEEEEYEGGDDEQNQPRYQGGGGGYGKGGGFPGGGAGMMQQTGGDGDDGDEISPMFNPFWNPKIPMPYPLKKIKEETLPLMREEGMQSPMAYQQKRRKADNMGQNRESGIMSPNDYRLQGGIAQSEYVERRVPVHPKYATYWKVL